MNDQLLRPGHPETHIAGEAATRTSGPAVSQIPRIADTFVRIEDKYLVPSGMYDFFLDEIQKRMSPGYPFPGIRYTFIESLYYDSPQLRFLQDHFRRLPMRFKLRTRRYGPNGSWQMDAPHLELKSKQNGMSRKERLRVGQDDLRRMAAGQRLALTPAISDLNAQITRQTLIDRISKVNTILREVSPQPLCAVRYFRRAFEHQGMRVTMDCGIRSQLVGPLLTDTLAEIYERPYWPRMRRMGCKIRNDSHFLLEIKHSGTTMDWLDELVSAYQLRRTSFSKYCYAMINLIASSAGDILQ